VFFDGFDDFPDTVQAERKGNQIAFVDFNRRRTIRNDFHFTFQEVTDLRVVVEPRKNGDFLGPTGQPRTPSSARRLSEGLDSTFICIR